MLDCILRWTGGQLFLTQKVCELVQDSEVEAEVEVWVERLIRDTIIAHWEDQDELNHFKPIRDRILRDGGQIAGRLLGLYQRVLQATDIAADGSVEQLELLLSGLVVQRKSQLQVYNRIYAEIFNQAWVDEKLQDLRPYAETLIAWETSNYQDISRLLQGQALQEAQNWAKNKNLSLQSKEILP